MSADSVVVFYGAQIALSEGDVPSCESKKHPVMMAAKAAGLDTYWADFIPNDDQGFEMLVGRRFGAFGVEDSCEAHVESGTVKLTMEKVDAFLASNGIRSPGKLIVRFHQDL